MVPETSLRGCGQEAAQGSWRAGAASVEAPCPLYGGLDGRGTICFPEAPSVRISEGFKIGCWRLSLEHLGSLLEAAGPPCGGGG